MFNYFYIMLHPSLDRIYPSIHILSWAMSYNLYVSSTVRNKFEIRLQKFQLLNLNYKKNRFGSAHIGVLFLSYYNIVTIYDTLSLVYQIRLNNSQ